MHIIYVLMTAMAISQTSRCSSAAMDLHREFPAKALPRSFARPCSSQVESELTVHLIFPAFLDSFF
jgi:hypothetical protein